MTGKSKRGFASMDQAKQREIASKGGKAAHQKGTAHEFTSEEAREAGRKGGEAVSRDRAHMAAIGREGGKNSHKGSGKNLNSEENYPTNESIGENFSDFSNSEANS
jgi:general stress protein YciG